jgi:hypothetical protein
VVEYSELPFVLRSHPLLLIGCAQTNKHSLYSNQQGCDGDRLYYDGCAMIIISKPNASLPLALKYSLGTSGVSHDFSS